MNTRTLYTQSDLDAMTFNFKFQTDHFSPYGPIIDTKTDKTVGWVMPCFAAGRKAGIGLLRDRDDGHLYLVNVMVAATFRDSFEEGVDVMKTILDRSMGVHYQVLCAGMNGGRFSYNDEGYHLFGIDTYPIARLWINTPKEDHLQIPFGNTTYGIQPISYARWVRSDYQPTSAETDSYQTLCLGLIPELHARREGYRIKVEAQVNQR